MELSIQTKGPNAEVVRQGIKDFFTEEYGDNIAITETTVTDTALGRSDLGTALAVLGIIIAFPGALLAALDLRERAKHKERLEVFLSTTHNSMASSDDHATITINETKTLHLRSASSEQLYDALMRAARNEQGSG